MGSSRVRLVVLCLTLIFGISGCSRRETKLVFQSTEAVPATEMAHRSQPLTFPYTLPDSGMIVEDMVSYSGTFRENGQDEVVENVAALMLYNPSERMVEFAAVSVEWGGKTLYFFVYRLPPNSRCLIPEKGKSTFQDTILTGCRELCVRWTYQEFSRHQLDYLGAGKQLTIINRDGRQQEHVTVWYKQYVREGDYYLGGVAYSEHLVFLLAEERRTVTPTYYEAGKTKIVSIRIEE